MSRSRGRRYDDTPKLNIKKVIATIIAIIVFIMVIISLKNLLTKNDRTKNISTLTTYIAVYENEKWGVIDNKGNIIIEPKYEEMIIIPDENEEVFICTYDVDYTLESYKTKVLNAEGEEILTQYSNIEALENTDGTNIWYEKDILKYKSNDKYGLISYKGKEILSPEYDNIYVLDGIEKSIIIEKDNKKGLLSSSTGEILIEPKYTEINAISNTNENGYIVKNDQNKYGLISLDKKVILDTQYDEIKRITGNNYYVVVREGKLEVIDNTGKVILDNGYDSIEQINGNQFVIIKNSKYGVITEKGEEIIPAEYEDLKYVFQNSYIAKKDGKYGIIDSSNVKKVDYIYESMNYIKIADFIEAENENYTTDIIDSNFNKVLDQVIISKLDTENGYLRVRKDDEYKYYNFKFEEKTNAEILSTNSLFLFKENGKYGYKNEKNEIIVDAIYDDAKEQNEFGYCAIKKDGLWGVLKSDGTVLMKPSVNLEDYLYVDFISTWHKSQDLSLNTYTK